MKVRFWGVRGSIPSPGARTVKYGGNTSCIEIRGDQDEILVLDAGTGIRELGHFLIANDLKKDRLKLNILLTHTHWDHIQGLPFFGPAYIPSTQIRIMGPVSVIEGNLHDIVAGQMSYSYFPVKLSELTAQIEIQELKEGSFQIGPFEISTIYLNHPILCLGYRISYGSKTVVTVYDSEPYNSIQGDRKIQISSGMDENSIREAEQYISLQNQKILDFCQGSDLLIHDAQYTSEEYLTKIGWGHSSMEHALNFALKSKTKRVAFFHHDPLRSDRELDILYNQSVEKVKALKRAHQLSKDFLLFFARERLQVNLD